MKIIYCKGCNIYLGEIRDAKLKKGIVYLCSDCDTKRVASDMVNKPNNNSYDNIFGDIFGGGFKK